MSSILTSAEILFPTTDRKVDSYRRARPGTTSKHYIPEWSDNLSREQSQWFQSLCLLPIFSFSCSKKIPRGKDLTACNFFLLSHLVCLCILCRGVVLRNALCKQEELPSELILYLSIRERKKSVTDDISRARKTTAQGRIIWFGWCLFLLPSSNLLSNRRSIFAEEKTVSFLDGCLIRRKGATKDHRYVLSIDSWCACCCKINSICHIC